MLFNKYVQPYNENQLDALFILSLFRQSTSTCFEHIYSSSSGSILYIYNSWYVLCFLVDSQLNTTTRTSCCVYTVYLLMMNYKYARNM